MSVKRVNKIYATLFMLPLLQRGCIWPFPPVHVCGENRDNICWKKKGDRAVFCIKARSPHVRLRHKHVSHSVLKRQFQPRVAAFQQWKRAERHRCSTVPCCYAFGRSEAKVHSPEVCVPLLWKLRKRRHERARSPSASIYYLMIEMPDVERNIDPPFFLPIKHIWFRMLYNHLCLI